MPHYISAEPLARMVQSITQQKRTGMLQVEQLGVGNAEWGKLYFEGGTLMRVYTERERGRAALQRISEWKQITCSFQGMSRPYPVTTPVAVLPQTDRLVRVPETTRRGPGGSFAGQSFSGEERTTRPLNPRQAEIAFSASAGLSISPMQTDTTEPIRRPDQPLILHGTRLEPYTPAEPARPSRAVKRWTTHRLVGTETDAVPSPSHQPPALPRSEPALGQVVLPGRLAIFKAHPRVSVAQAIQQMERYERLIFILLDGRRTIQDIARLIHQTECEVERTLLNLTQRGYIYYVSG